MSVAKGINPRKTLPDSWHCRRFLGERRADGDRGLLEG